MEVIVAARRMGKSTYAAQAARNGTYVDMMAGLNKLCLLVVANRSLKQSSKYAHTYTAEEIVSHKHVDEHGENADFTFVLDEPDCYPHNTFEHILDIGVGSINLIVGTPRSFESLFYTMARNHPYTKRWTAFNIDSFYGLDMVRAHSRESYEREFLTEPQEEL